MREGRDARVGGEAEGAAQHAAVPEPGGQLCPLPSTPYLELLISSVSGALMYAACSRTHRCSFSPLASSLSGNYGGMLGRSHVLGCSSHTKEAKARRIKTGPTATRCRTV